MTIQNCDTCRQTHGIGLPESICCEHHGRQAVKMPNRTPIRAQIDVTPLGFHGMGIRLVRDGAESKPNMFNSYQLSIDCHHQPELKTL